MTTFSNCSANTVRLSVNNERFNQVLNETGLINRYNQPALLSMLVIPFLYALCLPVLFIWFTLLFSVGGLIRLSNLIVYLTDFSIWFEMIVDLTTEINDFRKVTLSNWFFYLRELVSLINPFYKEVNPISYFDDIN